MKNLKLHGMTEVEILERDNLNLSRQGERSKAQVFKYTRRNIIRTVLLRVNSWGTTILDINTLD